VVVDLQASKLATRFASHGPAGMRRIECTENPLDPPTAIAHAIVARGHADGRLRAFARTACRSHEPSHRREPSMSLAPFFEPKSIAVIGASTDPARIGGRPIAYLKRDWLQRHPDRRLLPVNRGRALVQGLRAFDTAVETSQPIDLAIIAVPAAGVVDAIRDCASARVKAAIVCSAGFGEMGESGRKNEQEMLAIARKTGMRLLGPNCLGLFNLHEGLVATFAEAGNFDDHVVGGIAIASQSGATMSQLLMLARARGIGLGKMISTGNECDVDVASAIEHFAWDDQTEVILAYLEGCPDGARLVSALQAARAAKKPVIVLKVGRSAVGRYAARSHTGALAGEDAIFDAIFAQYGAHRAESFDDALDVAYLCARGGTPAGNRVGLVTISGGAGALMSDLAVEAGLDVAPLPAEQARTLADILPFAVPANPLDTTAHALNDLSLPPRFARAMLEAGYDVILLYLAYMGQSPRVFNPVAAALAEARTRYPRTPFVFCSLFAPESAKVARDAGFLVFEDPARAVKAIGAWSRIHARFRRPVGAASRERLPAPALPERPLNELETKRLLAETTIRVPRETLATTPDEATIAACDLGFPVVLKLASPDIAHKTELGGVVLDVRDIESVRRHCLAILERARRRAPDKRIDGVLVAESVTGGVEMILGSIEDPDFGTVVMLGAGGVLVEVMNDVAFRKAPVTPDEAEQMLDQLRSAALLAGVRGKPAADRAALIRAIVGFSEVAAGFAGRAVLEINPLVVLEAGQGVIALDAVLTPV